MAQHLVRSMLRSRSLCSPPSPRFAGEGRLLHQPVRGISIPPGEREKALLAEDPALKKFKSSRETVKKVKRIGDVLIILVSAGCVYQLYDVAQIRRAERLGEGKN